MTIRFSPSRLRRVLLADAATCAVAGTVLLAGAGGLSGPLGLPVALLGGAGAVLLACAAAVLLLATRPAMPRPAVGAVIALNALWAADSVALLLSGWVQPTGLGTAFVLAQAVLVLAFAEAEWLCVRRTAVPAA
ncbi:hypothetical protein [Azospirillum sp. ST 5-10]|uniref:hypothetical protein n=1 Tax=unclassified Azospirillum TaxID=2630922 RepID=UPI003F4A34CA